MTRLLMGMILLADAGAVSAHAEDPCRARCLLVDGGPAAREVLAHWPRPDVKKLLVADYEMVEGATLADLARECDARAHLQATATTETLLVAYATYYSVAGRSGLVDYVTLTTCDPAL